MQKTTNIHITLYQLIIATCKITCNMHILCVYSHYNTQMCELTCKIVPEEKTPLRTPNEIVVKWLEFKDAGKINVKHAIGQLAKVAVGAKVVMS